MSTSYGLRAPAELILLFLFTMAGAASGCSNEAVFHDGNGLGHGGAGGTISVMDDGAGGISSRPDAAAADASDVVREAPTDDASPPAGDATSPDQAQSVDAVDATDAVVTTTRSYEAEAGSLFGQASRVACDMCSGGQRVSLKADSGFTLDGIDAGGPGTHTLVVYYTNGDSTPGSIYIGVNGGDSQAFPAFFPPTGAWDKVATVSLSLGGFRAGTNNEVTFFIDSEQTAPDLDRVEVVGVSE